jgi:hypothetical protein
MPTYDPILPAEVAAGQPITSSLITRLRDNPLALISAVPTELTSGTSYGVPVDVTLLMVICVGGGGGGGAQRSSDGGGSSGFVKCGFVSTTGSGTEQISYTIGAAGAGSTQAGQIGGNGGDTTFNNTITGKGGYGGGVSFLQSAGAVNRRGEQTMLTGGSPGSGGAAGGGAGGVPWFLRTSSLGNGGSYSNTSSKHATGYGAGGGSSVSFGNDGGNGTSGIIFVLPLQA